MSLLLQIPLALAAFLGHFALAVWIFNRLHATAWPRRVIKLLEKLLLAAAAIFLFLWILHSLTVGFIGDWSLADPWLAYAAVCWVAALLAVPLWLVPKLLERAPAELVVNDTTVIDIAERLGYLPIEGSVARFLATIPGNELCRIHVHRKTLHVKGLPSELNGLSIAHLSDLHMIGDPTEPFYEQVVDATNQLSPDLICITGDILERSRCLPWIGTTLARLQARHGKYFICGNHEQYLTDVQVLRDALAAAGITDLGSRCQTLRINGCEIELAGIELPWFGTAPNLLPLRNPQSAFRILLSHSPDQFPFAQAHAFDLMLAGHTHGGQIRLPWLGALISPSWYGWRYAGGTYHVSPTLLHVSRGLSGKQPIRLNCPPEIALLVLES
jgi:predicted MPP superfamily phosphohydrolase